MILMQLKNIVKSFAGDIILHDINMEIQHRDRIAIVGRNGAGKSTLLKIMTGEMDYDRGEIFKTKDLTIGYLAQHNDLVSTHTILEEMLSVFTSFIEEEIELANLAEEIEKKSSNGKYDEKLINEYSRRQENFEQNGGYRYKSDVKGVLIGLGFPEEDFDLFVNDLSGGQKTRLSLGKLLLQRPELLILDEPTNHLDIATLTWLENYLSNYEKALLIVSHDRYFLDKIVNVVYEVAHKQTYKYHGSYSNFLQQKALNYERDLKLYERQQQEMKEMEDFIQRNIARASTTKRAQSRRKQLEKMEKIDRPLGDESSASFSFEIEKTSGNDVLSVNDFSYTHPDESEALFKNVSFNLHRGERVALIGENGIGKTTLLKAIMLKSQENIRLGSNVQIGYYAQEQENLTPKNTVLAEVWDEFPNKTEQEIRTVLGNFLFTGEEVEKNIFMLSGGEKARVSLAKLMLKRSNFLLLDEPTNHLDLMSKEVLEAALQDYAGTILFVSHDRYFINKIADKVFDLKHDGVTIYLGDYDYYLEKIMEQEEIKKLEKNKNTKDKDNPNYAQLSFTEQKRLQSKQRKKARQITKLEDKIEKLELKLEGIELSMTDPNNFNDHEKLLELTTASNEIKEQIERLMEEWTMLQE
ncbi:ABC-F family ATP-binding cassette domain-containing protein [Pseudogracilibacillus sp. SO30301A]|uniref:ABC-F family ATP-binding cassette domain-containing protein n=1 Tax=Pseudogracilibacillus sp. SO30301A TaxID=3098291 RepID=UPI00300E561D